ncbi:MAG: DUF5615 family PIN-like protein [Pyrinomonadaceae bacterium]
MLRQKGHKVLYVAEIEPSVSDEVVFERANVDRALLVTEDKDFGEIVFCEGKLSSGGIVLLRLAGLSTARKVGIVSDIFQKHQADLENGFCVVSPGRIRFRPRERKT